MTKQDRHPVSPRALDAAAARAEAIVSSLRVGEPSSAEVFEAFAEFDALPRDVVRNALSSWMGPLTDVERMDNATRVAHGLPLHPLRLRTLEITKDADVLDGGPIAEEQLRLAGKTWDGVDLAPEDRLDGELEGSFAGTLERHVFADADAPGNTPLFDVLLFAEHAGVVFDAGTTKQIALIAYGKVETRDRRTALGIEQAIAAPPAHVAAAHVAPAHVAPAHVAPVVVAAVEAAGFVQAPARKPRAAAKMTATVKAQRGRAGVQKRKS
ncbi:MAG: Histone H1-like protein [Myxococcaceae bacterium]|nr:Histone H1-like protein [Myxococcaceae bacterium]